MSSWFNLLELTALIIYLCSTLTGVVYKEFHLFDTKIHLMQQERISDIPSKAIIYVHGQKGVRGSDPRIGWWDGTSDFYD